jgi:hypothetical protein
MRLSESRGVAREDFLKNYQGFELDPRWLNRVSKLSACGTNATLWAGRPIDRRPRAPQHSPPHGLVAVHSRLRAAQGISDCWRSAQTWQRTGCPSQDRRTVSLHLSEIRQPEAIQQTGHPCRQGVHDTLKIARNIQLARLEFPIHAGRLRSIPAALCHRCCRTCPRRSGQCTAIASSTNSTTRQ